MLKTKTTKLITSFIFSTASFFTLFSLPSKANSVDDANSIIRASRVIAICDQQIAIYNRYGSQSPVATQLVVVRCQYALRQWQNCSTLAAVNLSDGIHCNRYFIELGEREGWV